MGAYGIGQRVLTESDSTGHSGVLLFFFLLPFVLRSELGFLLLFLLAFISFAFVTHIRFSLLKSMFPQSRLLGSVTEPLHR